MNEIETKTCNKCGRELPITEFYHTFRGRMSICRECMKEAKSKCKQKNKFLEKPWYLK